MDTDLISGGPLVLSSNNPFYLSFNFKYPGTSLVCATTVVPEEYWRNVYTLVTTDFHSVTGLVTMFLVFKSAEFPMLQINNAPRSLAACAHITGTGYVACYVNLRIGYHIVKVHPSSSANKKFGAYIVACDSKKCHCRSLGIQFYSDIISNNFQVPPLDEPEECPGPLLPTVAPISYPDQNLTLTEDIGHEIGEQIKLELAVEKTGTSSYLRTKQSANDDRPSSIGIGYTGVAIITLLLAWIVVPDLVFVSHRLFRCDRGSVTGPQRAVSPFRPK